MMPRILTKAAILGITAAAFVAGTGVPEISAASAQTMWKMHVVWVPARPEAKAFKRFTELVNERAKGKLQIELHPGASLGVKDIDMLRILPSGSVIQAAGLYPGYMTRDVPEYAITLPPGVVGQPEKIVDLLPVLDKIYQETYDKWGIKLLGHVMHPVRDTHILCKEPIDSLAQLKGKKLRVWEKFHVDAFAKLDVAAQVIGQNDLYVAMKTGVVDCAVYPAGFAGTISLQEVAPNASYLFPYVLHPLNIIVSKKAFDALPAETQKTVAEAAAEVQKVTVEDYLKGTYDREAVGELTQKGGRVLRPFSDADQATFTKAAREVWEGTAKELGPKASENRAAVLKAIGG
jgi:TRAP-type C4-dicarboxylate transport system substrate-binding protein